MFGKGQSRPVKLQLSYLFWSHPSDEGPIPDLAERMESTARLLSSKVFQLNFNTEPETRTRYGLSKDGKEYFISVVSTAVVYAPISAMVLGWMLRDINKAAAVGSTAADILIDYP